MRPEADEFGVRVNVQDAVDIRQLEVDDIVQVDQIERQVCLAPIAIRAGQVLPVMDR